MQQSINRVAVLGSGVMGGAIAAHIAGAGISVSLLDMAPTELTEQEAKKGLTLDNPAVRNRVAQAGKDRVLNPKTRSIFSKGLGDLITVGNFTDNMNLLEDADWIIEVIVERLDAKQDLFAKVAKHRKPGSIVSTNTSGISVNAIAAGMPEEFRQHFIGVHFFNPPRYMKLVELIPCDDCAPQVRDYMKHFIERQLGKTVILCKDTAAFIANRIGTFASVAGLQMIDKSGFTMAEIDRITGPVMGRPKSGTFRLMDMIGLDIPVFVAQNIIDNIDDPAEKAMFALPQTHLDLVDKKFLGDKTKQGFFKRTRGPGGSSTLMWDSAKQEYGPVEARELPAVDRASKCKTLDEKLAALVYAPEEDGRVAWEITKATLLYAAGKAEEISHNYRDIDTAMQCGYNWEYGPFRIWDAIGLEKSVARMKEEGETIPAWIEKKLASGDHTFISDAVSLPYVNLHKHSFDILEKNDDATLYYIDDGVLLLSFTSKANSVEAGTSEMLLESVKIAEKGYAGLIIANKGKNFSVGANLSSPTGFVKDMDFAAVEKRVVSLQQANMAIKYSTRPVIIVPFGMTLGGATEMTLHTTGAVAAAETYMGLVEVGVGLVPAGGGIKELLWRYMEWAGKAPKASPIDFVQAAWELIAMGKVSGSAHEAAQWGFLRQTDTILLAEEYGIEEAKKAILYRKANHRPPVKHDVRVTGETGRAAIAYIYSNMQKGDFISEYDAHLAETVAYIITGGDAPGGALVPEEHILQLEKEAFMRLIKQEKTQQRIEHMLKTGKRLSN
jgi:3-hydroxyacyl-CoA dehydrogenase